MKRQIKITNKHYDVTGNEILRILKHDIISKLLPIGNLGGGPSLKCIAQCIVLHYFGKPLAWIAMHFDVAARNFYIWLKRNKTKDYFSEKNLFKE
jgi:hypothetical protein